MAGLTTGRPRTEFTLTDASSFGNTSLVGATLVAGETERGKFNTPLLCKNWSDFQTNFGGLSGNWNVDKNVDFPTYAKQVLDYGVPLVVSRIEHYSDITDNTSGTSTFSTATVAGIVFTALEAGDFAGSVTISDAISGTADLFDISVVVDGFDRKSATVRDIPKVITSVEIAKIEAALDIVTAAAGTINMDSGVTTTPVLSNSASAAFDTFTETTGTYALDANSVISEAFSASTINVVKGQKLKFTFDNATGSNAGYSIRLATTNDGLGNVVSDTVDFNGDSLVTVSETTTVYINIVTDATAGALGFDTLAQEEIYTSANTDLAGGNYDVASIVNTDYIGNATAGNGIHAFDDFEGVRRIAIMQRASNTLDIALSNYVENRKFEMRAILRVPLGLTTGYAFEQYRQGTGAYAGNVAIDNHLCSMTCGYIIASDPITNISTTYSEIAQVLAMKGLREINAEAYNAAAGSKYVLTKTTGVGVNLGAAGKKDEADAVDIAGLNPVITHKQFGQVIWGNNTLQKEDSLLKHENISELVVDIFYNIKAVTDKYLLSYPNDIETWGAIYNENYNYLETLITNRAIWAYDYQGDQDVSSITDAAINDDTDAIDNGEYKIKLVIYPKSALKYVLMDITVVNGVTAVELGLI